MTPPTFYLETSVWGSLARRQPMDRKRAVRQLLRLLDGERGVCVVSEVVVEEVGLAAPADAAAIQHTIVLAEPIVHPISEEIRALAAAYIEASVLPERRRADALHIAVATWFGVDFVVSWNHRHMTRPLKRLQYEAVNRLNGFLRTPAICNPLEACDELEHR